MTIKANSLKQVDVARRMLESRFTVIASLTVTVRGVVYPLSVVRQGRRTIGYIGAKVHRFNKRYTYTCKVIENVECPF